MFEISTRSSISIRAACVLMRSSSPTEKFLVQLLVLPRTRREKDEIEVTRENDERNRTVRIFAVLALMMLFGASVCAVVTVEGFKGPMLFKIHLTDVF